MSDLIKLLPDVNDKIDSISGINNPDKIVEKFNKLRILFDFQFNEVKTWFNTVRTPGIEINAKHECIRIRTIRDDMLKMQAIYPEFVSSVQSFVLPQCKPLNIISFIRSNNICVIKI